MAELGEAKLRAAIAVRDVPLADIPTKWREEAHTQDLYLGTKMTGQLRRCADELEAKLAKNCATVRTER